MVTLVNWLGSSRASRLALQLVMRPGCPASCKVVSPLRFKHVCGRTEMQRGRSGIRPLVVVAVVEGLAGQPRPTLMQLAMSVPDVVPRIVSGIQAATCRLVFRISPREA